MISIKYFIRPNKMNKESKLSQRTILEIKEARKRINKGKFYAEDKAKKILDIQ